MAKVKVAIVGVGNCASSFIQGLQYYGESAKDGYTGLRNPSVGGLTSHDIQVVAAFDIDARKVGKDLAEAIFEMPNNAPRIVSARPTGVTVSKGRLLDGIGRHAASMIKVSDAPDADVAKTLKDTATEVLVNLLPSGAAEATGFYAEQALKAGSAFVNTTPNFMASNSVWAQRFVDAGLPLAGDDLVDQVGSTALHKTLLNLLTANGVKIKETYQLDVGGGTESLDTLERTRDAKRAIKTQSVASVLSYEAEVVAGSTDYVDFLQNKRDSYFWISGVYFGNTSMQIDLKFSTVDAPNAGSVLFDIVRAMKIALNTKQVGPIVPVCAYAFKRPPQIFPLEVAEENFKKFTTQA